MLRRNRPLEYQHILASDSETESDDQSKSLSLQAQGRDKGKRVEKEFYRESMKWKEDPDAMMRHAQMYQDYMKEIKIPTMGGSVIPFNTWQGLAKSMKKLYGQPLHYLTNLQLKQWDQSRIGTEDEYKPMDNIIHPNKAETTIWFIEEIHRTSTSAHHLSRLWLADPMYNAFIDPFVPQP